jgi:hypothetical protein
VRTQFWWGNLGKQYHLEYSGVDESVILKWIFRKWNGGLGLDWSGSEGRCEFGIEPLGTVKCGDFLIGCGPVSSVESVNNNNNNDSCM